MPPFYRFHIVSVANIIPQAIISMLFSAYRAFITYNSVRSQKYSSHAYQLSNISET
jgi:hypothetical protein